MIKLILTMVILVSGTQADDINITTHAYYYKGELTHLTKVVDLNRTTVLENNETNITGKKLTLTYQTSAGNPITITNRLIVKFKTKDINVSRVERDYNITQVKQRRRIHIFAVPDIEDVLDVAKEIYENEDVKYAQPSFIKKVKNSALIVENVENYHIKMHKKIMLANKEDIKSMKDEEGSVNYYKYYDDVFRYDDESYWQIHNKGGFSATAYNEGVFTDITSVADVDSNVIEAIDAGYTGKNIKVAVIDSAFSLNHPDLRFSDSFNIFTQNKDISPNTTSDFHGTAVA